MLQNLCLINQVHIPTNPPTISVLLLQVSFFVLVFCKLPWVWSGNLIIIYYWSFWYYAGYIYAYVYIYRYIYWTHTQILLVNAERQNLSCNAKGCSSSQQWFSASNVRYTVAANQVKILYPNNTPLLPNSWFLKIHNLSVSAHSKAWLQKENLFFHI